MAGRVGLAAVALGCALTAAAVEEEIPAQSEWEIFLFAMLDTFPGPPSEERLAVGKTFSQAGVSFDYPALLRLRRGDDCEHCWNLSHGDFELELAAGNSDLTAALLLEFMADFADGEILAGPSVQWCGAALTSVRIRVELFGDLYQMEGIDLPSAEDRKRYLIFSGTEVKDQWSPTARAAFKMVDQSIACTDWAATTESG